MTHPIEQARKAGGSQSMTAYRQAMHHWDRGQLREAIPHFQQALQDAPEDLNVIYRTILTLVALRDYDGCARWLTELLPHINTAETEPWLMAGFHYNLGVSHEAMGRWEDARRHYLHALTFDPDSVLPKVNLGAINYRLGVPEVGKAWHDKVLGLSECEEEARPTKAFLHLLRGDYPTGFREYEHRWKVPQVLAQAYIPDRAKRWTGEPLPKGKRILVVAEQGIGDVLMMARYVALIRERGYVPVLVVHGGLVRLMKSSFPGLDVYAIGEKHPDAGWWVPMMSLPYVFKTTIESIPPAVCIQPPSDGIALPKVWRRVGWVARGNPLHMGDKDRSCHTHEGFSPLLLPLDGVETQCLEEWALKEEYGIRDMADTASIVAQCDVIVTIDSAVAHLAGAMGKPVLLLPPAGNEWRWGLPDTPGNHWYPTTHTLFRRRHVDDWPEAIERVLLKLRGML